MNKEPFLKSFLPGLLAFGLALLAQYLLKGSLKNYSWMIYLIAVIIFVYLFRRKSISQLSLQAPSSPTATIRFNFLGLSIITTIIGLVLFNMGYNPLAWIVHVLSVILFIAAFIRLSKFQIKVDAGILILLLGILLLAGLIRFWQLDQWPFGTWYDEALNGNLAARILQDRSFRPVFYEGDSMPSHLAYLFALAFRFLGINTAAMRSVTAAFGVISVLFAYLVFSRWFNKPVGLSAAFLFAVMRYDLTFSRIAMHGVTTPAFELAVLYFFDRALERKQFADFAWLGLVIGFGLAFYTPFRLFAMIILSFLVFIALINVWRQRVARKDPQQTSSWDWGQRPPRWEIQFVARLSILILGMLIAIAPVIQFAIKNPNLFMARPTSISIFSRRDEPDLTKALWNNTVKHMLMFNVQGDRNGRHNWPGQPMLDPIMGTLFVLGLGYALWRWRDPPNLLMLLIFFGMNLGGILSVDFEAPQSLRSIGVMPTLVYFAVIPVALLTNEFIKIFKPFDGKRGISVENATLQAGMPEITQLLVVSLGFAGLLAGVAYLNINTYFNKQEPASDVWAVHSAAETIVSHELLTLAGDHDFVLSAMYDSNPTVKFLAGNVKNYQRWTSNDRLPLIRTDLNRGVVMLFDTTLLSAYNDARRLYPNAEFIEHHPPLGGSTVLYEVILTPDDLRAVSGVVARYYSRNPGAGKPVKEEMLTQASVDWTETQPVSGTFLANLSSTLYAPQYGSYLFSLRGTPGSELWIDEFLVGKEPLTLARGNHALRIQIPGGKNKAELWWQQPGAAQEELLPGAYLFRPPVTNSGLLGAYYPSPDWSGAPAFTQIDPEIAFYFHIIPLQRPYTVEWTGKLFAPSTGEYHFAINSVDGSQLILDGQVVVDNPNGHTTIENVTSLAEGWHDIKVRFSDRTSATQIYLYWTPPGATAPELVPTRYLSPPMGKYPTPNEDSN